MSRLFLRISLGILAALLVSFFLGMGHLRSSLEAQAAKRIPDQFRTVLTTLQKKMRSLPADRLQPEVDQINADLGFRGRLIDSAPELPEESQQTLRRGQVVGQHRQGRMFLYVPLPGHDRILVFGPLPMFMKLQPKIVLVMLLLIIPFVVITGALLAIPVVRRLKRLEQAAIRIGDGDLQALGNVTGRDATASLAENFNQMADKLQALLENQQYLLQAVSHELRTPLSRIEFELEMLSNASNGEDRSGRIKSIRHDLADIDGLVGQVSIYSRFTTAVPLIETRQERAGPLLDELADRLAETHTELQIIKNLDAGSDDRAELDAKYFRIAIQNLLLNALKHANHKVWVSLHTDEQCLIAEVADDGPGVPAELRQKIFEPFFRADQSRTRETGGSGLGLAIVHKIVESHGGSIELSEGEGRGIRFITRWPRTKVSAD
jgi:signal transduction histidine kinase